MAGLEQFVNDVEKFNSDHNVSFSFEKYESDVLKFKGLSGFFKNTTKMSEETLVYRNVFFGLYKEAIDKLNRKEIENVDYASLFRDYDALMRKYRTYCKTTPNKKAPSVNGGYEKGSDIIKSLQEVIEQYNPDKYEHAKESYLAGKLHLRDMRAYIEKIGQKDPISPEELSNVIVYANGLERAVNSRTGWWKANPLNWVRNNAEQRDLAALKAFLKEKTGTDVLDGSQATGAFVAAEKIAKERPIEQQKKYLAERLENVLKAEADKEAQKNDPKTVITEVKKEEPKPVAAEVKKEEPKPVAVEVKPEPPKKVTPPVKKENLPKDFTCAEKISPKLKDPGFVNKFARDLITKIPGPFPNERFTIKDRGILSRNINVFKLAEDMNRMNQIFDQNVAAGRNTDILMQNYMIEVSKMTCDIVNNIKEYRMPSQKHAAMQIMADYVVKNFSPVAEAPERLAEYENCYILNHAVTANPYMNYSNGTKSGILAAREVYARIVNENKLAEEKEKLSANEKAIEETNNKEKVNVLADVNGNEAEIGKSTKIAEDKKLDDPNLNVSK